MHQKALTQLAQYKNKLHNIAKSTDSENDWRIFRHTRNAYNKAVKDTKAQYYSNKLTIKSKHTLSPNTNGTKIKPEVSNVNKLWTTVKNLLILPPKHNQGISYTTTLLSHHSEKLLI